MVSPKIRLASLIAIILIVACTVFVESAFSATVTQVSVTVDSGKSIGTSSLSFGFTLHTGRAELGAFKDRLVERQLAMDANFKFVRLWDRLEGPRNYKQGVGPCTRWNEATGTGTFDWTTVDLYVKRIFSIGAEPLICLSIWKDGSPIVPPGMTVNPTTLLPNPKSYAAFAAAWVQHYKDVGLRVRYYEIFNEIQHYIGWSPPGDAKRIANFVSLFNAAYTKMHEKSSSVMVSTDCSLEKHFFDYFLKNGVGIDFLDFHKYESSKYPGLSDSETLTKAEQKYFVTTSIAYSIADGRKAWLQKTGKSLPAILSETCFSAAGTKTGGADPRNPKMVNAVRTALVARMGMLSGLNSMVYHCFTSSLSYEQTLATKGAGFGMINRDNDKPWYPYYLLKMIATHLAPGDKILQSSVTSSNFRTIAWLHSGQVYVLVISKGGGNFSVKIQGLKGTITYQKIDESAPWTSPKVQTGQLGDSLVTNGYAVALFQARA